MPADIINIFDFVPDGVLSVDVQPQLQAAFDAAENGVLLFPDARKIYPIGGFGLTIGKNTRLINAGATFLVLGSQPINEYAVPILVEPGFHADRLLIEIGRGRWLPDQAAEILHSRDRARAGPTAPALGLLLVEVRDSWSEASLSADSVDAGRSVG